MISLLSGSTRCRASLSLRASLVEAQDLKNRHLLASRTGIAFQLVLWSFPALNLSQVSGELQSVTLAKAEGSVNFGFHPESICIRASA